MGGADIVEDARASAIRQAMDNQNVDDWEQSWSDSDNELRGMEYAE